MIRRVMLPKSLPPNSPATIAEYIFDHIKHLQLSNQQLRHRIRLLERKQPKHRKSLRTLWFLVCTSMFMLQSYHVTNLYLQWHFYAEYYSYPIDPIFPPAPTCCFRLPVKTPCGEDCNQFYRTSKLFFDNTYTFKDIVSQVAVVTPHGTVDLDVDMISFYNKTTITYKLDEWICFHIMYSKWFEGQEYTFELIRKTTTPVSLVIEFHPQFANVSNLNVMMILGEQGTLPDRMLNMLMGLSVNNIRVMSVRRTEMNLLPPPFKTNCRDYLKENFVTQRDCYNECVRQFAIKTRTPVLRGVPYVVSDDVEHQNWTIMSEPRFDTFPVDKNCNRKCSQPACHLVEYFSPNFKDLPYTLETAAYGLFLQTHGDLKVNYKAKMTLMEWLPLVASCLGLWLGVSAYSLLDVAFGMIDINVHSRIYNGN